MEETEKLLFQYIMNYKAYRRKMIAVRATLTAIATALVCLFFLTSIVLGVVMVIIVVPLGAISILVSLHNEQSYMVFNTRFVIKNRDKRVSVPIEDIVSVKYRRAFYERDLATGTVSIKAKDKNGKTKTYRMRHIFNAADCVEFLSEAAKENKDGSKG